MKALSKYRQYACRLLDAFALLGIVLALAQICYAQQAFIQEVLPESHMAGINPQPTTNKECAYE